MHRKSKFDPRKMMELAEERGLGLKTLKDRAEQLQLPLPKYSFEDPYLVLTLFRSSESAMLAMSEGVVEKLNADEKSAWQFLSSKDSISSRDLMEQLGFDERKAQRVLKKLMEVDLARRVGKGPATRYEAVRL